MATYNELEVWNPKLWADGICRGKISYSDIGALQTGSAVNNTLIEGILGGPHPPIVYGFNPNGNVPIGASDTYPKPWRSASQRLQDGSYGSQIGPFARIVSIRNNPNFDNSCVDSCMTGDNISCSNGIWGRLGLGSGGQLAFRAQPWYDQAEGTYNAEYWNSQYSADWDSWKEWWANASKATVNAVWEDLYDKPEVQVEVAYDYIRTSDDDFFPGLDGKVYSDFSLDLLVAMVAIAAFVRW